MRSTSMSYAQIADQMGVGVTTAFDMVRRGMGDIPKEANPQVITNELAKIERRERTLFAMLADTSLKPEQRIQASNAINRCQRNRAALLGLDQPTKLRLEVVPTDVLEQEIQRLERKHGLTESAIDAESELLTDEPESVNTDDE
jgi:hypothetical protein